MSLINNANPGSQIELMCIIYRMLNRAGKPIDETKLISFGRPDTLSKVDDRKKRFPGELRFWADSRHKLWEKNSSGEYELIAPCVEKEPDPRSIANVVRNILFDTEINSIVDLQSDLDGVDHLFGVLSCILAVPGMSAFHSGVLDKNSLRDLLGKYLPSRYQLNDSELPEVLAYGNFLGFLESVGNSTYTVDPTRVIEDTVSSILQTEKAIPLDDFVDSLSEVVPVFDRGKYRLEVEGFMAQRTFNPPSKNKLSRSLSHSLYRLRVKGKVKMDYRSDDDRQLVLDLPTGEKPFSSIQLTDA